MSVVFIRFVSCKCITTSGVLVVLPANPVCNNKVCSCRYDKDGKVLVMRICHHSVEKLRDGYENVLRGMRHGTYGIAWNWQECTEEDGIAPHRKKECRQSDQDISQAQAGAHSRLYVDGRTLL